jgi:hypothetical protein
MNPTPTQQTRRWIWLFVAPTLIAPGIASAQEEERESSKMRSEVEAELPPIEAAYLAAPGDDANRRAYATVLYRLGNIWQANDVMAPLATTSSSNIDDIERGARLAYLVGDYDRAEELYQRLRTVAAEGSEAHTAALEGLVMVYYQTDRYDKVEDIELPGADEIRGWGTLLTFMKRFEGEPNQIEWATPEKVAHLPMINDYTQPGELPLFRIEVNGHPVEFILDTGGDRLYIDAAVAEEVGIRQIHKRQSKYAYTGGEYVDEPLGVAETVTMGEVTLTNVPVIVAKWKELGLTSDGVVTTQMLKGFLSTVDYDNGEIIFRERSERGKRQFLESLDGEPLQMPFWMTGTHLMYTKGSVNDRRGLNIFMDSGLGSSMPMVIVDETVQELGIEDKKVDVEGTRYYWVPIESHGIGPMTRGATQALGNVFVEENAYTRHGFFLDALISHQYLRHFGSWTIDFDTMCYYFPADSEERAEKSRTEVAAETATEPGEFELTNPDEYVGSYEIGPGVALEVTTADGVVFLQAPGQQNVGMEAVGEDTFLIRLAGATITFERDDSGAVVALVLDQAGAQTRATKR